MANVPRFVAVRLMIAAMAWIVRIAWRLMVMKTEKPLHKKHRQEAGQHPEHDPRIAIWPPIGGRRRQRVGQQM